MKQKNNVKNFMAQFFIVFIWNLYKTIGEFSNIFKIDAFNSLLYHYSYILELILL